MKYYLIFCLSGLLYSCNNSDKIKNAGLATGISDSLTTNKGDNYNSPATKTVVNFLKWYRDNMDRLAKIEMLNNYPSSEDSTKYYSVNFEGTEQYLTELKNSGYISDQYIATWRQYFVKCENDFKRIRQREGPPEGFEFDFIMWSQTYDDDLPNIEKANVRKYRENKDKASLILEFPSSMKIGYSLRSENGKWLIYDIKEMSQ
jgi:hypothetical protein